MDTIVWEDILGRIVSFKFRSKSDLRTRKRLRLEGMVVRHPKGLGVMSRPNSVVYTIDGIEEISVIVFTLEEEIIWKITNEFNGCSLENAAVVSPYLRELR